MGVGVWVCVCVGFLLFAGCLEFRGHERNHTCLLEVNVLDCFETLLTQKGPVWCHRTEGSSGTLIEGTEEKPCPFSRAPQCVTRGESTSWQPCYTFPVANKVTPVLPFESWTFANRTSCFCKPILSESPKVT